MSITTTINTSSVPTELRNEALRQADAIARITEFPSAEGVSFIENSPSIEQMLKDGLKFMKDNNMSCFPCVMSFNELYIPKAQRELDMAQVRHIIRNFDKNKVEVIKVNYDPIRKIFTIIDGHHTAAALKALGNNTALAMCYYGLTEEQQYDLFCSQYTKKRRITSMDEFKCSLRTGIGLGIEISKACAEYGVVIGTNCNEVKCISSIRALIKMYKKCNGTEIIKWALKLIKDAGWGNDPKAYREAILRIALATYPICVDNKELYEKLLLDMRRFNTSTLYLDAWIAKFSVTVTKHPEGKIAVAVRDSLLQ